MLAEEGRPNLFGDIAHPARGANCEARRIITLKRSFDLNIHKAGPASFPHFLEARTCGMEQTDGERLKSPESDSGCRDEEPSPISLNKTDAMSQGKALESQLKDSLRMIHALVGEKVDIQHILTPHVVSVDQVLQQRWKALKSLQMQSPSLGGSRRDAIEENGPAGHGVDNTIVEAEDKEHVGNDTDIRAEFVIESVNLLVGLDETLMSLVRYRGIVHGKLDIGTGIEINQKCGHRHYQDACGLGKVIQPALDHYRAASENNSCLLTKSIDEVYNTRKYIDKSTRSRSLRGIVAAGVSSITKTKGIFADRRMY
ncbi:hypothetical protein BGX34_008143 [Mortierella sp. NVP85]|nr:hypothetical protein BGX34_008143 [Mortierella sp. NVP85]